MSNKKIWIGVLAASLIALVSGCKDDSKCQNTVQPGVTGGLIVMAHCK